MRAMELLGGKRSRWSTAYKWQQVSSCFRLFRQAMLNAFSLALASAGKSSAAKIAIMAMTTSSSIKVNAPVFAAPPARAQGREAVLAHLAEGTERFLRMSALGVKQLSFIPGGDRSNKGTIAEATDL